MDRFHWALSAEAISFQRNKFFTELTYLLTGLKSIRLEKPKDKNQLVDTSSLKNSAYLREIAECVKAHSGFRIEIHLGEFGPAIEIPTLDRNHPLINPDMRKHLPADAIGLLKYSNKELVGSVNIMTGKVTGFFTEHIYGMYLPTAMLTGNTFSAAEIAAAMLHEMGHLFTYCEYATRTVTNNQILAGLVKGLGEQKDPHEREVILKLAKDALHLKEMDPGALSKVEDNKVIETVVITHVVQQTRSELGTNLYDLTSWEALSDQYAARQGAGKDLVTALYKLESGFRLQYRSSFGYYAMEGLKLTLFSLSAFSLPIILVPLIMVIADSQDLSYDAPNARFTRVKNQLVEGLKDPKLPREIKAQYLVDLGVIEELLTTVKDREQFFGWLYNLISSNARKRVRDAELAKQLESYVSNDFFVEAYRLEQIAKLIDS